MKITMTLTEIKGMVAREYVLPDEFDLEIVDSPQEETDDDWISNTGRDVYRHPDSLAPTTKVQVKFRDGSEEVGLAGQRKPSWRDDGQPSDIAAYRILND